ncbi:hypothetical protein TSOC_013064 [Tetrabaena socialis]|uniref:Glycosyl transferase family 25 domain-containing protein n=1 Tax=Tetrabaena socialis TaxID=47790 RepID=A0A2J7ZLB9_9CHLO|nr:hypothetical protein TSOC_013064 [Tetrabaena socialis]|eukprot:PNH01069.1 hypothetical protein TSOC_013064 [Tetrabaena socialis]
MVHLSGTTMVHLSGTFVINMDRSTTRLQRFREMMAKLQMPFERFRAVDGSTMTDRNRLCGGACRILG